MLEPANPSRKDSHASCTNFSHGLLSHETKTRPWWEAELPHRIYKGVDAPPVGVCGVVQSHVIRSPGSYLIG